MNIQSVITDYIDCYSDYFDIKREFRHMIRRTGLSCNDTVILKLAYDVGGIFTTTDISDNTYIASNSIIQSIHKLKDKGFITQYPWVNGELMKLRITDKGIEKMTEILGEECTI